MKHDDSVPFDPAATTQIDALRYERDEALDRLAQYESQYIPRTEDMPADAVGWLKDGYHGPSWLIAYHQAVGAMDVPSFVDAPDLFPDEPGPLYRHIVDVEVGDG